MYTRQPKNTLRYWEKEFKQIKPTLIRNRRYYSEKQINIIKLIKFLLKDKGMTINGVKNVLKSKINTLDDYEEGTWTPAFTSTNATLKLTVVPPLSLALAVPTPVSFLIFASSFRFKFLNTVFVIVLILLLTIKN